MRQTIPFTIFLNFLLFFIPSLNAQNPAQRENLLQLSEQSSQKFAIEKASAVRFADSLGWPVRQQLKDGRIIELMRVERGRPVYYTTYNAVGAELIHSDRVYPGGMAGLSLTGNGQTLGIWDGGAVRLSHQEFGGRVTQADGATDLSDHATHVAGTMIAAGVEANARGMSYQASLLAHDWNNDNAQMAAAAAAGLKVSQHSYGIITGWHYDSDESAWYWYGEPTISQTEDYSFGFYNYNARAWDEIARNAPDYLIVKSAGNDRGDGPAAGTEHYVYDGNDWVLSTATRDKDGGTSGFDCISHEGLAKNIMSVGAVYANRDMAPFSSWGPTDDGRIKPDIVAKGVSVYSAGSLNNSRYTTKSGTSMSGPMVSGSIGLLLEHQENLHPGVSLLSSTMKAIILHSADDMISGAAGPDYRYGWGLMDTEKAAEIMSENATAGGIHIYELTLTDGIPVSLPVKSVGGEPLRATIVWTDVPGTPVADALNPTGLMLVNDLDMRLTNSSSVTYEPYTLDPSDPTNPAGTGDNFRDNVEMIHIESPGAEEEYNLTISHKGTLDGGSQTFSLIITGNQDPSGIANPQSFEAISSGPDQIELNWTKNTANDNVMLLWSADNAFGMPDNGTAYAPGQQINGGGTVLYRGSNLSYSHTGLSEASTYYYRAFSYNSSDEYSSGRDASATTEWDLTAKPPRELSGHPEDHINASLSWLSPLLQDGFELYEDFSTGFGGYTQRDVDGSTTYSIQDVSFPNQGYTGSFILFNPLEADPPLSGDWQAFEGQKYAACFAATNPPNNDWLITPKLTVVDGDRLNFFAKSITSQYGLERFRVGVSNTGTQPGDFSIISAGSYLEAPTSWTEFSFDLSAHAGQEVYLAINCVSDDAFAFMVDVMRVINGPDKNQEVRVQKSAVAKHSNYRKTIRAGTGISVLPEAEKTASKSFGTYSIYRDDTFVGSTSGFNYTDTGLAPGTYSYTVKANYVDPAFQSEASNIAEVSITTRAWTGTNNADWFTAANWKGGQLPAATEDVLIPLSGVTNFPLISGGLAESRDLNIDNSASLNIAGDGQLSVNGVLTNENGFEGLVIEHGGTLLHQTTGVPATMKHDIPFGGWHFISAPVSGQTIMGSDFAPSGNPLPATFDFYSFDESKASNVWINLRGTAATPNPSFDASFVSGKGYLVAYFPGYGSSPPFRYQGQLQADDLPVSLGYTNGTEWAGWNLIGNPFPSGIHWGQTEKENITEDDYAYIYDEAAENYIYQDGGIIAAGQGFFVKVDGAGKSLSFTRDNRVHGGSYTKEDAATESLVLQLENATEQRDKTTFLIAEESSFDRDRRDALKLFSFSADMPQLYSYTRDETKVAVQSIPHIEPERPLRIGTHIPSDGTYRLKAVTTGDRWPGQPLYLKDLKTNDLHNLKANPEYGFFAAKEDDPDRFMLYFTEDVTSVNENPGMPSLRAWYHDQVLHIDSYETKVSVSVYDLSGRNLRSFSQAYGQQQHTLNLPGGMYVVHMTGGKGTKVIKVLIP